MRTYFYGFKILHPIHAAMNETTAPDMSIMKFILVSLPINTGDMPPITTPVNIILDMSINSLDTAPLYLSVLFFNSFLSMLPILPFLISSTCTSTLDICRRRS